MLLSGNEMEDGNLEFAGKYFRMLKPNLYIRCFNLKRKNYNYTSLVYFLFLNYSAILFIYINFPLSF